MTAQPGGNPSLAHRPNLAHRPSLTHRIADDLGARIVTQRLAPGTLLPLEAELCARYDASRSIVREAVKMLTAKGLLIATKRKGTAVQPESLWNLLDPSILRWMLAREFSIDLLIEFTDIRLAIEPRAAALAAQTASEAQRRAILDACDRMVAAERGADDPLESDIAFHVAVLRASNNRFVAQFTELAEVTLRFSIRRTNAYKGVSRASAGDHRRVADRIVAGQAARASAEMFDLIHGALELLLAAGGHTRTGA
jgi:DNA-binding FadR family transcriptional regulator